MPKKVTVFKASDASLCNDEETGKATELANVKDALRALKPLGVRFSTEDLDGEGTTITAWLEEKEAKTPKVRQALGTTIPAQAGVE